MPTAIMLLAGALIAMVLGAGDTAFDRGYEAARTGDYDRAIGAFTEAIESENLAQRNHARAFSNRGAAHHMKGDIENAIRDYRMALATNPADGVADWNLRLASGMRASGADRRMRSSAWPALSDRKILAFFDCALVQSVRDGLVGSIGALAEALRPDHATFAAVGAPATIGSRS